MKKYLIVSSFILVVSSTTVQAADMVSYRPLEPMVVIPVFSWTGGYIGGEIGGGWARAKNKPRKNDDQNMGAFKKTLKPDGFIGGIYGGYNFDVGNNIVLGVDTDFLWTDVKDSGKKNSQKLRLKEKWIGATRLRAGYAFDRLLPYIAGGVSYADLKGSYRDSENKKSGKSKTRAGWNVGAGIDYIPPVMGDHLVLRAEYRYSDFGKKNYKFGGDVGDKYRIKYNQNDFRVGIAYKF